jgi:hypothetical protein
LQANPHPFIPLQYTVELDGPWQTLAHAPQLFGSVKMLTQLPLQQESSNEQQVFPQEQVPLLQHWPGEQHEMKAPDASS